MKKSDDGSPECGSTGRTLGVRVPEDVAPDGDGCVHPGGGGMSVAPDDPMWLRPHRRPRTLGGTGPDPVFRADIAGLPGSLTARQDAASHALVEPAARVQLPFYIIALHGTRLLWSEVA